MREANGELAHLEVRDVGKLFREAVSGDVPSGTDAFDYFAACITAQNGNFNKWDKAIGHSVRVPLGVCAGIGARVVTQNLAQEHRVADALESGNVWLNSYNLLPPGLPFGGAKHSGFGRETSAYTLDA